ncbi:MAG TPA: GNAT family N-acetyltransferase [Gemmataceae bacterium]|nr:GNAT family N-acetyltransferase [Gemmataceae bacterium]
MSASTRIDRCKPDDLPELVRRWDEEFVFAKGRQLSVAERFPEVVSPANVENIHLVRAGNGIAAAAAVKLFGWVAQGRTWRGAMVGLVYTRPDCRGRGLASRVLHALQEDLGRKADFGVLWTTIPAFYKRLGWVGGDTSLFGEAFGPPAPDAGPAIRPRPLCRDDIVLVETIRSRWAPERVERSLLSYRAVPLPACSVEAFLLDGGDGEQGYALVGRDGETGYLYELVGHPGTYEQLWGAVTASYRKTYINDRVGGALSEWLNERGLAAWKRQDLAMWLPLSARSREVPPGRWSIPYLDRF